MASGDGARLFVTMDDVRGLRKFSAQLQALEERYPKALPRLLNQVGRRARTRCAEH